MLLVVNRPTLDGRSLSKEAVIFRPEGFHRRCPSRSAQATRQAFIHASFVDSQWPRIEAESVGGHSIMSRSGRGAMAATIYRAGGWTVCGAAFVQRLVDLLGFLRQSLLARAFTRETVGGDDQLMVFGPDP